MMHLGRFFIWFALAWLTLATGYAQEIQPKDLKQKADKYYEHEKYFKALPYYLKYAELKETDDALRLRIGHCYLKTNRPDQALIYLEYLAQQKEPIAEALLYLAQTHHQMHQFSTATAFYKDFLALLSSKDEESRYVIKDEIKRCAVGAAFLYKEKRAIVENMGDKINTSFDEFAPVYTPAFGNRLYFSSIRTGNIGGQLDPYGNLDTLKGEFRSDVYLSALEKGDWQTAQLLDSSVNTKDHDVLYGSSRNGNQLYLGRTKYKAFDYNHIFAKPAGGGASVNFPADINSGEWDGSAYFFTDSILVFSSDRPGGYGGKDLYISLFRKGAWTAATNMGPRINSSFDEETPFLASDGATLYFSSNGTNSVGGHDVFYTFFDKEKNTWREPENVGFPINSAGDDMYFRISDDGLRAYFASSRANSYGARDIYVAYFKRPRPEQLELSDNIAFEKFLENPMLAVTTEPKDPLVLVPPVAPAPTPVAPAPTKPKPLDPSTPSYVFTPVFYQDYENLLITGESIKELNKLIKLLNQYAVLRVGLGGHTDNYGQVSLNLHTSVKNASSIADYLMDNGIASDRIVLYGFGPNYPIAVDENADGSENKIGRRLNRRVQIIVHNADSVPVIVTNALPEITDDLRSPKSEWYSRSIEGVKFKVQIKALKQLLEDPVLTKYQDPAIETAPNVEYMRYTIGAISTFAEAVELRQKLVEEGFKDAFIVAYIDGKRLNTKEVETLARNYPELAKMVAAASE